MAWRLLEHTADVGVEGTGASQGAALSEAGKALSAVVSGVEGLDELGQPDQELAFEVEGTEPETLAVAFLGELVWRHDDERLLWRGGEVAVEDDGSGTDRVLRARVWGRAVRHDPAAHAGVEVKAVTYHGIESRAADGGWRVRAILDI